jgi:hypothetical protein
MTDSPHEEPVHPPGPPWTLAQHPTPAAPLPEPPLFDLRLEQRAPTGDGVKDLRPLPRAP